MSKPTTLAAGIQAVLDLCPKQKKDTQSVNHNTAVRVLETAWWDGAIYVVSTLMDTLCDGDSPFDRDIAVTRQVAAWSLELSERSDKRTCKEAGI